MEYSNLMALIARTGHTITPVVTLCRETFVACNAHIETNELTVILHHQINANPYEYGDHVYKVCLDLNRKQFETFRHWKPCPLNKYANPGQILVTR